MAGTDSALTFLPLGFLDENTVDSLISTFNDEVHNSKLTRFQEQQFTIQREWLEQGAVPQVELIMWSRALVNPGNASCITVFAGGLVCLLLTGTVVPSNFDSLP